MKITQTWLSEPGCGIATGRDACRIEGEHINGMPISITVTRSMIYREWFQWHADAQDGDGWVGHADGSMIDTDDLREAATQVFRIAATTPFKRGNFHRLGILTIAKP